MRKFRVWDKKHNCIVESTWAITDDGELINLQSDTGDLNQDDYVIQFSTGLKDKNGIDIFEGDILACPWDFNPDYKSIDHVVFWGGSFRLAKNEEPEYPEFGPYELWGVNDTPTRNYFWCQAEIIGNILTSQ
jgi:hypothetical protein